MDDLAPLDEIPHHLRMVNRHFEILEAQLHLELEGIDAALLDVAGAFDYRRQLHGILSVQLSWVLFAEELRRP